MNSDDEYKQNTVHKEAYSSPATDSNAADYAYDQIEEKRLIRKVDWRLLPILGALYSIALIDRTNVSSNPFLVPVFRETLLRRELTDFQCACCWNGDRS